VPLNLVPRDYIGNWVCEGGPGVYFIFL